MRKTRRLLAAVAFVVSSTACVATPPAILGDHCQLREGQERIDCGCFAEDGEIVCWSREAI